MMRLHRFTVGESAGGAFRRNCLLAVLGIGVMVVLAGCGKFFPSGNTLVAVSISPGNPTIKPSATQQFTASGTFGDGSTRDVTSTVTWSSSSTHIATINTSGLATAGAGTGSTTITATSGGLSASTTLTVSNNVVTSIAVTSPTGSVLSRATGGEQFTATATLTGGGTQDVTQTATWSSSNTAVASVSTTGFVTPLSTGSATISASSGGVTGQISITVQ